MKEVDEFVSHDFLMKLEQIHKMDCLMEMLRMRTSTTDEWPINIAEVSRILTSYANVTRITIESNSVFTKDYTFHETFTLTEFTTIHRDKCFQNFTNFFVKLTNVIGV